MLIIKRFTLRESATCCMYCTWLWPRYGRVHITWALWAQGNGMRRRNRMLDSLLVTVMYSAQIKISHVNFSPVSKDFARDDFRLWAIVLRNRCTAGGRDKMGNDMRGDESPRRALGWGELVIHRLRPSRLHSLLFKLQLPKTRMACCSQVKLVRSPAATQSHPQFSVHAPRFSRETVRHKTAVYPLWTCPIQVEGWRLYSLAVR